MDRPIETSVRRRAQLRRWLPALAVIVLLASGLVWGADLLRPSIRRDRVRTTRVESGPLEASLTASGTVVPAIEHVISSPIDARVLAVLRRVGDQLKGGDPIVRLDTSDSELVAEKLRQNIALKNNEQARTRLTLQSQLIELDGQITSKDLELQALKAALASNQALAKEGLLSQEALRESELKAAQAAVDLGRLRQSRVNAEATNRAQLDGLTLEMQSLRAEDAQQRRLLELTTTKSDRDGVLTFVLDEEGALVRKGDVVARVADLTAFRVEATTSDVNASRILPGQPVSVRLDTLVTTGRVSVVEPQMQNGALRFEVALDEPDATWLRSNLRVDVQVITDRKPRVLRVARGPFAQGGGAQQVFVLRNDRAYRTPVRLGVSNFDWFEVVEGLAAGDEIIASDMRDYESAPELRVK
ncbi:efflux RND transporter periplasmic adaptor subunit [Luteitalea sp.]|uniref:efflux RND transporter periplasmic adaptor subunit n=1 Tax=Luteitalea sp. TaxID=2004800 RepID=UPI0025C6D312|nr:HlyD family efflux transporter periplasmic adaptor subunit [Luteitalea sp.]